MVQLPVVLQKRLHPVLDGLFTVILELAELLLRPVQTMLSTELVNADWNTNGIGVVGVTPLAPMTPQFIVIPQGVTSPYPFADGVVVTNGRFVN